MDANSEEEINTGDMPDISFEDATPGPGRPISQSPNLLFPFLNVTNTNEREDNVENSISEQTLEDVKIYDGISDSDISNVSNSTDLPRNPLYRRPSTSSASPYLNIIDSPVSRRINTNSISSLGPGHSNVTLASSVTGSARSISPVPSNLAVKSPKPSSPFSQRKSSISKPSSPFGRRKSSLSSRRSSSRRPSVIKAYLDVAGTQYDEPFQRRQSVYGSETLLTLLDPAEERDEDENDIGSSSLSLSDFDYMFDDTPEQRKLHLKIIHSPYDFGNLDSCTRKMTHEFSLQRENKDKKIVYEREIDRILEEKEKSATVIRKFVIQKAEKYNLLGLQSLFARDFIEAIEYFNKALFLTPRELSYYFHRAEAFLGLNDVQSAIDNYRRVCHSTSNPEYISMRLSYAYFTLGQSLFDYGNVKEAYELFVRSWRLYRDNDQLLLCMAVCLFAMEEYQDAHDIVDVIVDRHPTDADFYVLRAKMYHRRHDIASVYSNLLIVRKYDPNHPEIPMLQKIVNDIIVRYRNTAFELVRKGELKLAIACLSKAIHIHPRDESLLLQRGILYHNLGIWDRGITDLETVAVRENMDVSKEVLVKLSNCYHQLGRKYQKFGEFKEAIHMYDKCIEYQPGEFETFYGRGECYEALLKYDESLRDYYMCISLKPREDEWKLKYAKVNFLAANRAFLEGNIESSKDYYNTAIEYDPNLLYAYIHRAKAEYILGQYKDSIEDCVHALRQEPGNVEVQEFLIDIVCRGNQADLHTILNLYQLVPFDTTPKKVHVFMPSSMNAAEESIKSKAKTLNEVIDSVKYLRQEFDPTGPLMCEPFKGYQRHDHKSSYPKDKIKIGRPVDSQFSVTGRSLTSYLQATVFQDLPSKSIIKPLPNEDSTEMLAMRTTSSKSRDIETPNAKQELTKFLNTRPDFSAEAFRNKVSK